MLYHRYLIGVFVSDVGRITEVAVRRARLVLGWVTGAGSLSRPEQPSRSTQPGHLSVGGRNEYRPNCGDALWLGVKTLLYGTDACPTNASVRHSLEFALNRVLLKIFGALFKDTYRELSVNIFGLAYIL